MSLVAAALTLLLALIYATRRALRGRADEVALMEAKVTGAHLPPSLHPVIDPTLCIGSASCVSACPEGDVLGLVSGAGVLIQGAACIGHGRCALECPVDAIKLVMGTAERGVELPEVTASFESTRRGVYVVGELGGMGLIRNAMRQGLQAGGHLADRLEASAPSQSPSSSQTDVLDVLVVGAGPAGIAAAVPLAQKGLQVLVAEREGFGGTVAQFPRHKVVMMERLPIPGYGDFGAPVLSKEALVEGLQHLARRFDLRVLENTEVMSIDGEDLAFTVHTGQGVYSARKVVLATGRRGRPRRLEVPGEDSTHVSYALVDPEQYAGASVLVVGGGDSAVEAALDLAGTPGCRVSISYRRAAFNRCRKKNRERLDEEISKGALTAHLSSEVERIEPDRVRLRGKNGVRWIDASHIIVCAGGTPPSNFLDAVGVGRRRHHGEEAMANPAAPVRIREGRAIAVTDEEERTRTRRLELVLFALGLVIVGALAYLGGPYYLASEAERIDHPMHALWRPSGDVGHGIGVVASFVLLSNFIYPVRKRWRVLKGFSSINRWLSFHVFVGILSPLVIAFHAAFQSNNAVATVTFSSLLIVVGTGLVGRYAYAQLAKAGLSEEAARRWRRFMDGWRVFHIALALLLVLVMGAHVGVSLYLGYGWLLWR